MWQGTNSRDDRVDPRHEGAARPRTSSHPAPATRAKRHLQEVFRLIARGHTDEEIAPRLDVSVKTVETSRASGPPQRRRNPDTRSRISPLQVPSPVRNTRCIPPDCLAPGVPKTGSPAHRMRHLQPTAGPTERACRWVQVFIIPQVNRDNVLSPIELPSARFLPRLIAPYLRASPAGGLAFTAFPA